MIKSEIRKKIKEQRSKMLKEDVSNFSLLASKIFISSELYKKATTIMLYWPLGNETDTRPILKQIYKDKKNAVLPVTNPETNTILPVRIKENTPMAEGAYKIKEPTDIIAVKNDDIDVIIVPGIAFDRTGVRVGFGKGCYDRFLENTKAKKIGYCYEYQIAEKISSDSFDINMDYLITEKEWIICE